MANQSGTYHIFNHARGTAPATLLGIDSAVKSFASRGKPHLDREEWASLDHLKFRSPNGSELAESVVDRGFHFDLLSGREFREFQNALSGQGGAAGAFTIPAGFLASFESTLGGSALRRAATVHRVERGGVWKLPLSTSESEGTILGENQEPAASPVTCGVLSLSPKDFSSGECLVSYALNEDATPSIWAAFMGATLAALIVRRQNTAFTASLLAGATPVAAASASVLSSDDLVNLIAAVGAEHFESTDELAFFCHPTIDGVIKKLKDGAGNPIFRDGGIYGYPIRRNAALDSSVASASRTVTFGRHAKFHIVDVNSVLVRASVESRYLTNGQVLWIAIMRSDGALANVASPVAALTH